MSKPVYTDAQAADRPHGDRDETHIPRMSTSHAQKAEWKQISRLRGIWDTH